ncbi:helix-turn-helix domain-containing protein [Endothiovibrio diazotrophicus]
MEQNQKASDERKAERARNRRRTAAAFGDLLRQLRNERGLSQLDLALEADLDQSYVALMERGARQPTLHTLLSLARALERPVVELIEPVERRLRR